MSHEQDEDPIKAVADCSGPDLDELVALAWYFPEGYPPFGMYGVAVYEGSCHVFRDGIGEFDFRPCHCDDDAFPIYDTLGLEMDECGSKEREAVLRDYVTQVRGTHVDRSLTLPMERFEVEGNCARLIPKEDACSSE